MPNPPKLVVLSLDGVPHGLLMQLLAEGHMPNFARLCEQHGRPRMMRSCLPTISNVAWATYATGRNPGKHGVFGFIDRRRGSYDMMFPNGSQLRGPNIWEVLSSRGRKVFGMNVPSSYPPRPVNGILIGGFLSPSVEKAAYPPEVVRYLKEIGYRIDTDAELARRSKHAMLEDLDITLEKRTEAMLHFLKLESWDFFHTHIMGTDRINHFLLRQYQEGHKEFQPAFRSYYQRVDDTLGKLLEAIGPDAPLIILSDHGFCPIKYEVQLSRYLVEKGWTAPAEQVTSPLAIDPARSRAFCQIPGRIYVNLRGREAGGCVALEDFEATRQALTSDLLALRDPHGRPVIRKVLKREEVYWPDGADKADLQFGINSVAWRVPPYDMAPDLIAVPYDGYDLKMGLIAPEMFIRSELEGMHTYHDAIWFGRHVPAAPQEFEIRQVAGLMFDCLGVEAPQDMDTQPAAPPDGLV